MSGLDERIQLAVAWLGRCQKSDGQGGAGWGWVDDVPPNPQNTAEVVCALSAVGQPVPRADEVVVLLRRRSVQHGSGPWEFDAAPIDVAWRLRALLLAGVLPDDPDIALCVTQLRDSQDADSGGWRMSAGVGPVSITATAAACQALAGLATDNDDIAGTVLRGVSFLAVSVLSEDVRAQPMYAMAFIASVLTRPEFVSVGGKRTKRSLEQAVERMMASLEHHEIRVEEEPFRRGAMADTWRHLSLHLAVGAVVGAEPAAVFEPTVRRSLTELLDLQEMTPIHIQRGGFRTSPGGPITSYATTLALEAMAAVRQALGGAVNPGRVFDVVCRTDGAHHSDARNLIGTSRSKIILNSHAGAAFFSVCAAAGLSIAVLAVSMADSLPKAGSRALVVWGTFVVAIGALVALITRYPSVSKARVAAPVFAGFTAVVLPVITFLLS
ncbi:prenyltransferase/squalene oxidase repeat-containing protein [Nocardia asteroides]|uniref:prenyltransferase/squalene oxidase repeat-containing protein n=1 Tax=Nocardia asteroides TaxID=1824 RepID=UPI0033D048D8